MTRATIRVVHRLHGAVAWGRTMVVVEAEAAVMVVVVAVVVEVEVEVLSS